MTKTKAFSIELTDTNTARLMGRVCIDEEKVQKIHESIGDTDVTVWDVRLSWHCGECDDIHEIELLGITNDSKVLTSVRKDAVMWDQCRPAHVIHLANGDYAPDVYVAEHAVRYHVIRLATLALAMQMDRRVVPFYELARETVVALLTSKPVTSGKVWEAAMTATIKLLQETRVQVPVEIEA